MSILAMKQALDAITNVLAGGDFDNPYADLKQAGAALKQAIAEGEKREWVGLTDEEFDFLVPYCESKWDLEDYKTFAKDIEAKLKEKNG